VKRCVDNGLDVQKLSLFLEKNGIAEEDMNFAG